MKKEIVTQFHTLTESIIDKMDLSYCPQLAWGKVTDNELISFHMNSFFRFRKKNMAVDFMCEHMSLNAIYFIIGTFREVTGMDDLEKKVQILLNRNYRTFIEYHPQTKKPYIVGFGYENPPEHAQYFTVVDGSFSPYYF